MGAATAELVQDAGAEVVVMDFAEVKLPGAKAIHVNLAEEASIDAAVDECGGPIHALFSCAGVADGTPGIEKINFVGHRHLINRMLAGDMLPRGSAIGFISSAAGLGWESSLAELKEYLDTPDFDSGAAWAVEHGYADYFHSKQAVCAYVAREAFPLLKQGIRINAICPGPTDTPLAQANAEMWLGFGADYPRGGGYRGLDPARAGLPARVPVQRCGGRDLGHHPDQRRRLRQLRDHRGVPAGHAGGRVPARPQLGLTGSGGLVRRRPASPGASRRQKPGRTETRRRRARCRSRATPTGPAACSRARRCSTGRAPGSR